MARFDNMEQINEEIMAFVQADVENRASIASEMKFKDVSMGTGWINEDQRDSIIYSQHGGISKDGFIIIEVTLEQGKKLFLTANDEATRDLKTGKYGSYDCVHSVSGRITFIWPQ